MTDNIHIDNELLKGVKSISNDRMLKIVIEILKYKIKVVASHHQLSFEDAKTLVLNELAEKM